MAGIKAGDQVVFYLNERLSYLRRVQEKGDFECHKGRIPWQMIRGKEYGDVVTTHMGVSFTLLKPSLAELMKGVKRRTTIAYPKDIGYMLLEASIAPGVRLAEVGSGSGALTSILARYVQPLGHVYSFERRPEFMEKALKNVERLGLADYVTFKVRDVALEGFGVKGVEVCVVDVAEPWSIVKAAREALQPGGRWVSLSPTTEQLQETRRALDREGFVRVRVWEILMREMYIRSQGSRPRERMVSHTAYMLFADLGRPDFQDPACESSEETIDFSSGDDKLPVEIDNPQEE